MRVFWAHRFCKVRPAISLLKTSGQFSAQIKYLAIRLRESTQYLAESGKISEMQSNENDSIVLTKQVSCIVITNPKQINELGKCFIR